MFILSFLNLPMLNIFTSIIVHELLAFFKIRFHSAKLMLSQLFLKSRVWLKISTASKYYFLPFQIVYYDSFLICYFNKILFLFIQYFHQLFRNTSIDFSIAKFIFKIQIMCDFRLLYGSFCFRASVFLFECKQLYLVILSLPEPAPGLVTIS